MRLLKASHLLAIALLAALTAPASAQSVPFQRLGTTFIEEHCGTNVSAQGCDFEQLLENDFARIRLGAIGLVYPAAGLEEKNGPQRLTEIAVSVLDMQDRFLEWLALEPEVDGGIAKDLETLESWVEAWDAGALKRVAKAEDKDLLVALEAPEEVVLAAGRFKKAMASRAQLGLAPQFVDGVRVLLCPTRKEFMQTIGYLGLRDSKWADQHWIQGADQWTQCWTGETLVLALEYAPWSGFDEKFEAAMDPKEFDQGGDLQHVVNQIARAFLFRVFNNPDFVNLERALAANLVVQTRGKIVVLDGEGIITSSGGRTMPYSRFVPGGLSEGGVLPAIPAGPLDQITSSKWRKSAGSDFFLEDLRKGQQEAAKVARKLKEKQNPKRKDPFAHFLLSNESGDDEHLVTAPFLGEFASEQRYPAPEFLNDYRVFFKSYQTAFHHWLRTVGVDEDPEKAQRRYAMFLRELASPANDQQVYTVLDRVYGIPTSARDGESDSLEWRFLRYVGDKKRK